MTTPRPDPQQGHLFGPRLSPAGPAAVQLDMFSAPPLTLERWGIGGADGISRIDKSLMALPAGIEEALGSRWGDWLRRTYTGGHAVKRIARDFSVSQPTAKVWLAGQAPYARHIVRALRLHGAVVLAEVLAPGSGLACLADVDRLAADLDQRIAKLGHDLAVLRETL